jgi:hypothetical protein
MVSNGGLEKETQVAEDSWQRLSIHLDPCEVLSQQHHVQHDGDSQKTVFTDIVRHDGIPAIHEDVRNVFIECPFAVPDCWLVLDDNSVVDVFPGGVEGLVVEHHVIQHPCLAGLLGLESVSFLEVVPIIVAEVVVAHH